MDQDGKCRAVVLISGRGTNLQSLIDCWSDGHLPIDLRAVISNEPRAMGLERARQVGIDVGVVHHREFPDRGSFDAALRKAIDAHAPDLLLLAGFMRILTDGFIDHYLGRMLNIHPSLLPKYQGLDTHRRALQAGDTEHGASVHFVTRELDGGPVIIQAKVPVLADDTPERLAARVLEREHRIFPLAVRLYADGRVKMADNQVIYDRRALGAPLLLTEAGKVVEE